MLGLYGLNIIRMIIHIIQVLKIADVNETKILKLICMHPFRGISVTDTRMHLRVFSDLHMHFNCDVEMISLAPDSKIYHKPCDKAAPGSDKATCILDTFYFNRAIAQFFFNFHQVIYSLSAIS